MRRRTVLEAIGLALVSGCVPMTFSRDAAIDFARYEKAGVDVRLGDLSSFFGPERASAYLASELARDSGFEEVTIDLGEEGIDLFLTVNVSLIEHLVEDEYGFLDFEYEAIARFVSQDPAGAVIDSGTRAEVNQFPDEAIEGALDEVALRYFRPYRL